MKIIDAHMHYYNKDGFVEVAKRAGYTNTAECWQQICQENNIVFSVAMGNTMYTSSRFGGVAPRLIDLSGTFNEDNYNQPYNMGYCLGIRSTEMAEADGEKTAQEFEFYLKQEHCLGLKLYPGYETVYVNDKRHWPLFELAEAYNVPVVIHTGDTARPDGLLKYSHPLTVDDAAVNFRKVNFVIAHCGCPWFIDAAEVAGKNPNVSIDLSGLMEGMPKPLVVYHKFQSIWRKLHDSLNYFGDYSRIMYGSDWPLVNIPTYIRLISYIVPEEHHDKVFYENALRIFNRIPALLDKKEQ